LNSTERDYGHHQGLIAAEKGKPIERLGRKATDLRAEAYDSGVARKYDSYTAIAVAV